MVAKTPGEQPCEYERTERKGKQRPDGPPLSFLVELSRVINESHQKEVGNQPRAEQPAGESRPHRIALGHRKRDYECCEEHGGTEDCERLKTLGKVTRCVPAGWISTGYIPSAFRTRPVVGSH